MELGKKLAIFLLGMGPKFGPLRKAENPPLLQNYLGQPMR